MRRRFWPMLGATIGLLLQQQVASAQTLKLATLAPDGSVWDSAIKEMAADWQQISGGEVKLRVYPGGVAGDDADIVRKMRIGQLQAGALTVAGLSDLDDSFNAFGIPLFFDSYDELYHVLKEVEPVLQQRLSAKGWLLLNWGNGGWAHLFSTRAVRTVADLRTVKIYTWAGDQRLVEWWKRNGFQPVPLAMTDILTGLQTGLIDAVPTTPLAALSLQWFRQTGYMHDLPLAPVVGGTVVSLAAWEKIPAALRTPLQASARKMEDRMRDEIPNQDRLAIDEMRQRGLKVIPSEGLDEWRREAARLAETMRGELVPPEVFDRVLAARDAFRATVAPGGSR